MGLRSDFQRASSVKSLRLVGPLGLAFLCLTLAGCTQTTGEAIVIEKKFIPAATEETKAQEGVRDRDQWILITRMVYDLRIVRVHTEKDPFDRSQVGDRVTVTYSQGNYTGTIWGGTIR